MSMELSNCKQCGRAFMKDGSDYCKRCRSAGDESYKIVKQYVYDHPRATIAEVHEATEVPEKQILQYLREGRLEIADENNFVLDCQRCGAAIKSGRYCDQCAQEMKREFQSAVKPNKKEEPERPKDTKKSQRMYVDVKKRNQ